MFFYVCALYLWVDGVSVFKDGIDAVSIAIHSHLKQRWRHQLPLASTPYIINK